MDEWMNDLNQIICDRKQSIITDQLIEAVLSLDTVYLTVMRRSETWCKEISVRFCDTEL